MGYVGAKQSLQRGLARSAGGGGGGESNVMVATGGIWSAHPFVYVSCRTIQLIIRLGRPTEMGSRSQRSRDTLPGRVWTQSF